jgi:hypothetical protein
MFLSLAVTKFCNNCKHFIPSRYGDINGKCFRHPIIDEEFLITGIADYKYCKTARSFESLCGFTGKDYESMSNKTH